MKYLTKLEQVKILKKHGFKFNQIIRHLYASYEFNPGFLVCSFDSELYIGNRKYTKSQLLNKIDEIKIRYYIRFHTNETRLLNRIARNRRKAMKVKDGGMSWAPIGIKIGEPKGQLKLVA